METAGIQIAEREKKVLLTSEESFLEQVQDDELEELDLVFGICGIIRCGKMCK